MEIGSDYRMTLIMNVWMAIKGMSIKKEIEFNIILFDNGGVYWIGKLILIVDLLDTQCIDKGPR